jgi:hypothetical protein
MNQQLSIQHSHFILILPYLLGKLSKSLKSEELNFINSLLISLLIRLDYKRIELLKKEMIALLKTYKIDINNALLVPKTNETKIIGESLLEMICISIDCLSDIMIEKINTPYIHRALIIEMMTSVEKDKFQKLLTNSINNKYNVIFIKEFNDFFNSMFEKYKNKLT